MTSTTVLYLVAGAACGGFINGMSGTGTALFALGFFLIVLDPVTAVAIVALMSILIGLQGLWIVRHEIRANKRRLLRFLFPGLIGVPIGLLTLHAIDARTLRIGIGVFLVLYGSYFSFRSALPRFERSTPVLDGVVGLVGGIMGGAASVSGAVPVMWVSLRPWPRAETRAVLQPYNIAILGTTVTLLAMRGTYDADALRALAVILPVGLAAAQIGIYVFRRIGDDMFRRVLIGLTLLVGLGILLQELAGS